MSIAKPLHPETKTVVETDDCAPFLFGAQWRAGSAHAAAWVLADLAQSPQLTAASRFLPKVDLSVMANAMLGRQESIDRVSMAVERAARAKHAEFSSPFGKENLDRALDEMHFMASTQWRAAWSRSEKAPLTDTLSACYSEGHAIRLASAMAPDDESLIAMMNAIAAAAATELEALGREFFGAEALLATRVLGPKEHSEHHNGGEGWMLAEIDRAALRNTVQKSGGRDEKDQNNVAPTARPIQKGPREMLAWEFPLVYGAEGGMGIEELISVVVGIDLTASEAANAIRRVAPHWTLTEIASGLIGADAVAGALVDLFAQAAQEAGMEIDTRRFDATSRLHARLKLQQGWRTPDGEFGKQTDDALAQGARVSVCWAPNEALPTIETKGSSADRRSAAQFVAGRLQSEMGKIASAVFGENAVVLAQTMTSAVEAITLLAAHAQRAELNQAAQIGQLVSEESGAGNFLDTAAKPRKARSL